MNSSYQQIKKSLTIFLTLLSPSIIGLTIYSVIFFITFAVEQNEQFNLALQTFSLNNFKGTFVYGLVNSITKLLNTQIANTIAIYTFWIVIGMAVYFIGSSLYRNFHELTQDISIRHYLWPQGTDKNRPVLIFFEKTVFRIGVFIAIIIYLYKVLPSLFVFIRAHDLKFEFTGQYGITLLKVFLAEFIVFHVAVILLRLLTLRKRVVGI